MITSLRALLADVIDYAGLFPPAKLDMDNAVREYKWLRTDDNANWILGRFVCPAKRLAEMDAAAGDDAFDLCVIGTDTFAEDLDHMAALRGGRVAAYETKYVEGMDLPVIRNALGGVSIFLEIAPDDKMGQNIAAVSAAGAMAKLRTGGLNSSAFPSSARVAQFISNCVLHDVNFKATAGLHHPLFHYDEEYATMMHGFLNVLLASALAAKGSDTVNVQRILEIEDLEEIEFSEGGIRVLDFALSLEDIAAARRLMMSFGSCSVTEPLEDLAAIGLA
jgi:hypothetical protein